MTVRGPLTTFEVDLIGHTRTGTGLTVWLKWDPGSYLTGIRILPAPVRALNLESDPFQPPWNYTLSPQPVSVTNERALGIPEGARPTPLRSSRMGAASETRSLSRIELGVPRLRKEARYSSVRTHHGPDQGPHRGAWCSTAEVCATSRACPSAPHQELLTFRPRFDSTTGVQTNAHSPRYDASESGRGGGTATRHYPHQRTRVGVTVHG
ncbi:MAG: ISAzo13-like element transposase-related protein [Clostridia bacterium]